MRRIQARQLKLGQCGSHDGCKHTLNGSDVFEAVQFNIYVVSLPLELAGRLAQMHIQFDSNWACL